MQQLLSKQDAWLEVDQSMLEKLQDRTDYYGVVYRGAQYNSLRTCQTSADENTPRSNAAIARFIKDELKTETGHSASTIDQSLRVWDFLTKNPWFRYMRPPPGFAMDVLLADAVLKGLRERVLHARNGGQGFPQTQPGESAL
jgi:hypothetical protein